MSWEILVPIIVIILLVLNSVYVVFWLRPKQHASAKEKTEKTWKRKAVSTELFITILVIIFGGALAVVPVVAPTSIFSNWIAEHGVFLYIAWCFVGIVALGVVFKFIRFTLKRNDTT